jgi:hypothetical protein
MSTHHGADREGPGHRTSGDGARLFQLFTLCFTLAVALACTGQPFSFGSGSSGGSKKKKRDSGARAATVVVPGSAATASVSTADAPPTRVAVREPFESVEQPLRAGVDPLSPEGLSPGRDERDPDGGGGDR